MNIIIKPYGSALCYCRPDTTWERENRDFYSPECVNELLWAPVIFARISKAGKCIGAKFASRYYDAVGCGMLMYGAIDFSESDSRLAGPACAHISSCIDHTSILPMPMYAPEVLENEKALMVDVTVNGAYGPVVQHNETRIPDSSREMLEEAICKASQLTSLRIGDYVAVEMASLARLADKSAGEVAVQGTFCENGIFGFKLIF